MGWLVMREYLVSSADLVLDAALSLPPGATFFVVSLGDRQIGTASITTDTIVDGVRVVSRLDLDLPYADRISHLVSATDAVYSRDLRLNTFTHRATGALPSSVMEGSVTDDSLLTLRLGRPELEPDQIMRQPTDGFLMLPSAIPFRIVLEGNLRVGREIQARVIDPATLSLRIDRALIVADSIFVVPDSADLDPVSRRWVPATYDTVRAFRLEQTLYGLPLETWVDQSGYVVYATTPLGFTLERSAFELASENYRRDQQDGPPEVDDRDWPAGALTSSANRTQQVVRMTTVLHGGPAPEDSAGWASLDLGTPWQGHFGDTVRTSVQPEFDTIPVLVMDYHLPYPDEDAWQTLERGAYDGDDPLIAARARRIIGPERRVRRAVELLTQWVTEEVALTPGQGSATASYVLDQEVGDADGKAVLFVALCRAVGIPARPVAGFVYRDGVFAYHSWAEVWLTEWVGVDPTLGQPFADASHIRLALGGLALPGSLPAVIGRLRPRMLTIEVSP